MSSALLLYRAFAMVGIRVTLRAQTVFSALRSSDTDKNDTQRAVTLKSKRLNIKSAEKLFDPVIRSNQIMTDTHKEYVHPKLTQAVIFGLGVHSGGAPWVFLVDML